MAHSVAIRESLSSTHGEVDENNVMASRESFAAISIFQHAERELSAMQRLAPADRAISAAPSPPEFTASADLLLQVQLLVGPATFIHE